MSDLKVRPQLQQLWWPELQVGWGGGVQRWRLGTLSRYWGRWRSENKMQQRVTSTTRPFIPQRATGWGRDAHPARTGHPQIEAKAKSKACPIRPGVD